MTLIYLGIAFIVGVLTGHVLRSEGLLGCATPSWLFPSLTASLVISLLVFRRSSRIALAVAIGVFSVLGAWRYASDPFERCWTNQDLAFYQADAGVKATIEGEVIGFPDVRDKGTHYQVAVNRVVIDGHEHLAAGRAMVEAARYPIYAYGDTLRINGLLLTPPVSDDFDYRRFLAVRNIHSLVRRPDIERTATGGGQAFWRILYGFRSRGAAVVDRIMPEPAAALTNGMVLGIEGGISDSVNSDFKATGTSHLIVISGSNIAFLAGALAAALGCVLSKRRAALATAPLVLLYVLFVGADAPALRAGVMGLLALGAIFFGRRGTAYVSLCAAGMVMLALNPLTLWDIGFQLSFMTSLGLILFSRPLSRAALGVLRLGLPFGTAKRWARLLEGTLVVNIAAQAAVLPVFLVYFGRLSPISLLTNCLVLPVQPAILSGGIVALLAGAAWQPLGQAVGTLPWLLLSYTVGVVRATASMPFASLHVGRVGPVFVGGYYLLLILTFTCQRIARVLRPYVRLQRAGAWGLLLAVFACFALAGWRLQPDGRLHIAFVPFENGEATVIVAPNGQTAWVWDGRGDGEALARATRRGGWVRGNPDIVLAGCDENPWQSAQCVDPARLTAGSVVALAGEVRLVRLSTNGSPALLLTYGRFRTLLPATLSTTAQAALGHLPALSVLKTAAPGTGAWPAVEFLSAAQSQLALWPLETNYPPDVAGYLAREVTAVRVEPQSTTEVVTDGRRFWVMRYSTAGPR